MNRLDDAKSAEVFKRIASVPRYSKLASIGYSGDKLHLQLVSTVRDFDQKKKLNFETTVVLDTATYHQEDQQISVSVPSSCDATSGQRALSPSGTREAVCKTVSGGYSFKSFDVTTFHGDFYIDESGGCIAWSPNESKLVYTASSRKLEDDAHDGGEGHTGKPNPLLFILDIPNEGNGVACVALSSLEFDSVSDAFFSPDSTRIYFLGLKQTATPLGLKYCTNRPTGLYSVGVTGNDLVMHSSSNESARSPRLTPKGDSVVYLSGIVGGPHAGCARLDEFSIVTGKSRVIVPIINIPGDDKFPGLYVKEVVRKCWVMGSEGACLILSSSWGFQTVILTINLKSGSITNLTLEGLSSWNFLGATSNGWLISSRSSPTEFQSIMVCKLQDNCIWKKMLSFDMNRISNNSIPMFIVKELRPNVEVMLVQPSAVLKIQEAPLIIMPHGGPHSGLSTDFSLNVASFVERGFACLLVNYTGSTGYGQAAINALVGRIGELEVEDVHAAAEWACQQPGISNVNNFIFGGSHGGFIAAHLIARYPDFYRGAALRNPVTDIGAMISDTDIPDWCYAEAGIDFNPSKPNFQVENYSKLYGMSPISRIKERVSPALLMLGEDDRRVPPSQGKRWAEKLIGNGHSVTTLMFPDTGHALDSVDAERYGFEACSAFFIFNLR